MRIYKLTPLGHRLARSVSSPDNGRWRAIHYLDRVDHATPDQLTSQGVGAGDMARLRRGIRTSNGQMKPIIEEIGG